MRKCLVINRIPLGKEGKLRRKHYEQVKAFVNMGFDTYYIGYDDDNKCYIIHDKKEKYICDAPIHGLKSYSALFRAAKYASDNYGPFDIAYMRMIPAFPKLLSFLKYIRKSCNKVVYEFPTFPYDAEENQKGLNLTHRVANLLDKICRNQLKKYVDLAIVLTSDVSQVFGIPALFLRNGIDVSAYKTKISSRSNKLEILCMGKLQRWHGYDRVIDGVIQYKEENNVVPFRINILGDGDVRNALIEQATKAGVSEYFNFPGIVVGEELDAYFDKCGFAFESLGLHRLNLTYSSTLKSREYLARGIPFVYSLPIPGIDESCDYCLQIEANESPVDFEKVLQWYQNIENNCGERMRQYAFENYSWESQFGIMLRTLGIE